MLSLGLLLLDPNFTPQTGLFDSIGEPSYAGKRASWYRIAANIPADFSLLASLTVEVTCTKLNRAEENNC
jgi:hypothetical protein